jgi:hypothetical protein
MSIAILLYFVTGVLSELKLLTPPDLSSNPLFENGAIYGTTAVFGTPQKGHKLLGKLFMKALDSTYCTPEDFPKPAKKSDVQSFALVNRGGDCSFVDKTRIAQNLGFSAVVVIDDCKADGYCRDSEGIQRIVMADDGTGEDIKIPSLLIAHNQGEILAKYVTKSTDEQPVIGTLVWTATPKKNVDVDFWYSSGNKESMNFMKEFGSITNNFIQMRFTPHIYVIRSTFRIPGSSCIEIKGMEISQFYCDPNMSSKAAIQEDLRQICIWKDFNSKYFKYIEKFNENCFLNNFTEDCAGRAIKDIGIDSKSVKKCMDTYKPVYCEKNTDETKKDPVCRTNLLQDAAEHKAWSSHALQINGWRYSGPLEKNSVGRAICSGLETMPSSCDAYFEEIPGRKESQGISVFWLLSFFVFLGCSVYGSIYIYKKSMQKTLYQSIREEVMLEVRAQMQDYSLMTGDHVKSSRAIELGRTGFTRKE